MISTVSPVSGLRMSMIGTFDESTWGTLKLGYGAGLT
ncbi:hypothetical protein HPGCJGGD_0042 [Methylobacterium haplocladii]|nr:hypothetical protein HPGCJGGD_0042 [Methylobacterium haplocladii]